METELEFYKKYHTNNINKWIHFLCIPMIILSIILLLNNYYIIHESYTKKIVNKIKLSSAIIFIYIIAYFNLSLEIGLIMTIYFIVIKSFSNYIISNYNHYLISKYLFICGWLFQFIGHYYIEGKKPALIDSLIQSFFQAPLFSLDVIYPQLFINFPKNNI